MFFARFTVFLAALSLAFALRAQDLPAACTLGADVAPATLTCPVGTAFFLDAGPPSEIVAIYSTFGFSYSYSITITGGSLPPGLTLSPSGLLSGTETTPGTFTTTFTTTEVVSYQGQSSTTTESGSVVFVVTPNNGPPTAVDPAGISFSLTPGSAVATQSITIGNRSNQSQTFTAAASTTSGGDWLSVSSGTGSTAAFAVSSVLVSANASTLAPGTYTGNISITVAPQGGSFNIPVLLTVSSGQQSIVLSQTGLFFTAVQGGGNPPGQSISVVNGGAGSLNVSVAAATVSGGNWLSVSAASGSSNSSSIGSVTANINIAGLAPGTYYGQIQFTSAGVANSPQTVAVVLNISAAAQSPGPSLSTTGLIFVMPAGGAVPTAQSITVTDPSPNSLAYATTAFPNNGASFYTVQPPSGTVTTSQPQKISVQPAAGLKAGVYLGELTITFSETNTSTIFKRRVAVVLVVIPSSGSTAVHDLAGAPLPGGCTPTKLIPVFTQLGNNFQVSAAWPTALEVTVVDDCGAFPITGSVVTTFSSGDPALSLTSLKNGRWTGTWQGRTMSNQSIVITAQARQVQPPLQGSAQIGGKLQANAGVPSISAGGVVSAASNAQRQPLAPGSYIAIYGTNLSTGSNPAPALPLPTQLGGTQVILGGKILPLNFAGSGQINAIVPFDVPVNTTQQLIVMQGSALSVPEPVVLSPAQPAVFTQNQSGTGLGVIVGYKADGSGSFVVDAAHPVSAGDTLVIYCTGLGPVDQAVAAGSAGPSSPLAKAVNTASVTIGGRNAAVSYAGLAPALAVYQVNAVVPSGVAPGIEVPLLISVAGLQSIAVTVAVT